MGYNLTATDRIRTFETNHDSRNPPDLP